MLYPLSYRGWDTSRAGVYGTLVAPRSPEATGARARRRVDQATEWA